MRRKNLIKCCVRKKRNFPPNFDFREEVLKKRNVVKSLVAFEKGYFHFDYAILLSSIQTRPSHFNDLASARKNRRESRDEKRVESRAKWSREDRRLPNVLPQPPLSAKRWNHELGDAHEKAGWQHAPARQHWKVIDSSIHMHFGFIVCQDASVSLARYCCQAHLNSKRIRNVWAWTSDF